MKKSRKIKTFAALLLTLVMAVAAAVFFTACNAGDPGWNDGEEPSNGNGLGGSGSSATNVQEQGVDEADIVKVNDAGYIFKAQTDGVTVSRAAADGKLELIKRSKASEGFTPKEMFVYNDKYVIVIGAKAKPVYGADGYYNPGSYEMMIVRIYDYAADNGKELSLLRYDEFPGTYKASRLFLGGDRDGKLFLITNYGGGSRSDRYYNDYYSRKVRFNVTDGSGGGFLIARFDMSKLKGKYRTGLYAGSVYDVYVSRYAIYAMRAGSSGLGCDYTKTTEIDKISLDTLRSNSRDKIKSLGGYSPDRFCLYESMYEDGSYLFVVNQRTSVETDRRTGKAIQGIGTYVYAFDNKLKEVGRAGPLAPGEQLKSARFDGGVCYVVTFRQVDPLFKVDISDPAEPRLTGELKIDGFSTYMQMFGEGRLIGIGYGANAADLKVTLFGVSGDYPDEVNSIILQNSTAEARDNPRAILCEPSNNIFAFAAYTNKPAGGQKQGAYIFGIEGGELVELAFITDLPEGFAQKTPNSRRQITRIVRIGGVLFTISDSFIVSYNMNEVLAGGVNEIDRLDTSVKEDAHTVTFVTGEPGVTVPTQYIEPGQCATEPPPIVKDGRYIAYWSKNGLKYGFANSVRESFTLYAVWEDEE